MNIRMIGLMFDCDSSLAIAIARNEYDKRAKEIFGSSVDRPSARQERSDCEQAGIARTRNEMTAKQGQEGTDSRSR